MVQGKNHVVKLTMKKATKYFSLFIVVCLFFLYLETLSSAQPQLYGETRAVIEKYHDNDNIQVRPDDGSYSSLSPSSEKEMFSDGSRQDLLWIARGENYYANLSIWNSNRQINQIARVGRNEQKSTTYGFPCLIEEPGRAELVWGFQDIEAPCNVYAVSVDVLEENSISLKSSTQKQTDIDAAGGQIQIVDQGDLTYILVYYKDNEVVVDVLVGSVNIISSNGLAFDTPFSPGNRFVQSAGRTRRETFNLEEVLKSSSTQSFLDEENWSPEVSSRLEELESTLPAPLTDTQREILDTHNRLRSEVSVPSLSWSADLADYAQEWADQLSRENGFRHRDGGPSGAGENIAAGSNVELMLNLWAGEKSDYDPSTGACRPGTTCGHYTQMVWRSTTEIGCGVASHGRYGRVMVCNYRPPGNYIGQRPY